MEYKLRGLTPHRLAARKTGPIVIANSIPKGGTHLLTRCLSFFPALSYSAIHYTRGPARVDQLEHLLKRNGNGRFMAAHLWWSRECSTLLEQCSCKSILMLRDPRDVVIFGTFYVSKRKDHHLHEYFSGLSGLNAQITAYITGVDASNSSKGIELANINNSYGNYLPWINETFNLLVLYEDLIGPKGGGKVDKQINQIRRISNHLEQHLLPDQLNRIAENVFWTRSVTFRKGISGDWRKYFNEDHIRVFKDLAGQLLVALGYEKNNDW